MEEKKPRVKILVACHKADPNIRQDDIYMPIQVGAALHPELDLGFQKDNEGDNISEKNGSYCELTALYWAWKNLRDVDYIGLAHYRRYFDFATKGITNRIIPAKEIPQLADLELKGCLKANEVILPTFFSTNISLFESFNVNMYPEDLYILYKVFDKHCKGYLKTFEKYMLGNKRTAYNMFVMSKDNFDKYCEWLFKILGLVESKVKPSQYILYRRIFGYMGELLLPIFCLNEGLNIKEKRVIFAGGQDDKQSSEVKIRIRELLYKISFNLSSKISRKSLYDPFYEMYLKMDGIEI